MRRGGEALRERMVRTERPLKRVAEQAGAPLASHANATVRAGGKRLRPLLVVLAAESAGGPPDTPDGEERLLRAAVAVELVHSATLVHDDLIDGAQLRRGRPTVAAVAGREVAVATGDLLFSRRSPSSRATRAPRSCARSRMPARRSPPASCCSARTPTPRTSPSSATCAAAS